MMQFFRRVRYLLNRRRFDEELRSEMEFHREMAAGRGGAQFGNALRLREEARDAWGWTWMDRLVQDLRYGARVMGKSPGFTLAAVLMLAIGIGANTAVFGFFNLMVLRPLDVHEPETLLRFHRRSPHAYAFALPYPQVIFFREHSRTLKAVLAVNSSRLSMEGEPKQVDAHFVSGNYFSELGASAAVGRLLDPARDEAGHTDAVIVLSHGFWQRRFGADPLVIGRTIHLNGKPGIVIGVASPRFSGLSLDEPALWAPIMRHPYFVSGSRLLTDVSVESSGVQMFGRLQPGLTPKAAEDELEALAAELRRRHPAAIWKDESLPSQPAGYAKSLRFGDKRGTGTEGADPLYALLALMATLVLLILAVACGNLANLLLARGVGRQREIAIRISVGAGTGRLIRQLFTESLLLGLLGAAAGLLLGGLILRTLLRIAGAPSWLDPTPDWRVVLFAVGIGLVTAVLFGLLPAFRVGRQRQRTTLTRQVLVAAQVAASCVLLIVAGLLGRAVNHAVSTHPGFEYKRLITIDPALSKHGYAPEQATAYLDTLRSRLQALPGVDTVSFALSPPLGRVSISAGVDADGRVFSVQMNRVDPEFFEAVKIPLVRGRNFTRGDKREAIVSDSLARAAWPGEDPLGKRLAIGEGYTVIGVAGAARLNRLEDSDSVEAYMPIEPEDLSSLFVVVRAAVPPEGILQSVTSTARAIATDTFPEVELVKSGFERKLRSAQYSALTVTVLGSIAHLLACLGIVGLVAYTIAQRTKEIGIRMALGAEPLHVLSVVAGQFSPAVIAGMLLGAGAAAALSRVLRGMLYGISNLDPLAYLITLALFAGTLAVAALLPAARALRVDPLVALRHD
jgi:predicted permease